MKTLTLKALAVSVITALAVTAHATVIDFNSNATQAYFVPSVVSQGFTFVSPTGNDNNLGTSNNFDGAGQSNGTVYLTAWSNTFSTTLVSFTANDSHLFDLESFDFNNAYPGGGNRTHDLTVVGTYFNNTTTSQVFTGLSGVLSFTQLNLNASFQDLKSVSISASGDADVRGLFDNFTVDAAVPEGGSTIAFIGLGMTLFLAVRRKIQA